MLQCPMFKIEGDKTMPEQFAEEAKFYTEARLLQRTVEIILEGASNQNLLGTVVHPVSGQLVHTLLEGTRSVRNITGF